MEKLKIGEHIIQVKKIPYKSRFSNTPKTIEVSIEDVSLRFELDRFGNLDILFSSDATMGYDLLRVIPSDLRKEAK